jgi:hypothetical protein
MRSSQFFKWRSFCTQEVSAAAEETPTAGVVQYTGNYYVCGRCKLLRVMQKFRVGDVMKTTRDFLFSGQFGTLSQAAEVLSVTAGRFDEALQSKM